MLILEVNDQQIIRGLRELASRSNNMRPALMEIGEDLLQSTKERFHTKKAPDGTSWQENASVTLANKGRNDPLIGETHQLSEQLHFTASANELDLGSTIDYAAMQQFGGKKSEFPNLWGDIPARPFLGISDQDKSNILQTIQDHLTGHAG